MRFYRYSLKYIDHEYHKCHSYDVMVNDEGGVVPLGADYPDFEQHPVVRELLMEIKDDYENKGYVPGWICESDKSKVFPSGDTWYNVKKNTNFKYVATKGRAPENWSDVYRYKKSKRNWIFNYVDGELVPYTCDQSGSIYTSNEQQQGGTHTEDMKKSYKDKKHEYLTMKNKSMNTEDMKQAYKNTKRQYLLAKKNMCK